MGKILRKARARLAARRLAHATTLNSVAPKDRNAYKAPGSMRKKKGR